MQSTQSVTLADALVPRFEGQSRALSIAREVALMAAFAGFVAVFAQIAVKAPWTPVPFTGQTFAVLVTGGALGASRGAGALTLYMLLGILGVPVFTPDPAAVTSGTWDLHFVLPWAGSHGQPWDLVTGGYIVGFILAGALVGFFAERKWDRGPGLPLAMLLGNIAIYALGVLWLQYKLDVSMAKALEFGLYPFIASDLLKLLLAAMVLPGAWLIVDKVRGKKD